jgi:ABC-type multidrug transport system fused ATPase/permease subunit
MFQMLINIETDIENVMFAQFQFISMKRLHDYTSLPQEAEYEKESDAPYQSYTIRLKRTTLGKLENMNSEGGIYIVRKKNGYDQHVLEQADQRAFKAPEGFKLLDPTNTDLNKCEDWHCLVAVNGKRGIADFDAMVQELCRGSSSEVVLEIRSGWLVSGAHVVLKNIVAGYGDTGVNVLHGVDLEILPRTKAGIVGTTGCGKSTLLLCLLRILEPKGGTILINGVDTQMLGLRVLRTTIGMVPQDPVLMQCSVRDNLDPFGQFEDDVIWKGLELVQMKGHIASLPEGLASEIQSDGSNLSFGQRQLLCMARMVIRQPALILLDEATSALDPATQQQVQHTIEKQFPDSTLVMIAHRLETVANFDKVIVMNKGKVEEQGPPSELRQVKNGVFARMWAAKQTW